MCVGGGGPGRAWLWACSHGVACTPNQLATCGYRGVDLETGAAVSVPPEFWRTVARTLNLGSKEQQYAATALTMFERSMRRLAPEGRALSQQLLALLPGTTYRMHRCAAAQRRSLHPLLGFIGGEAGLAGRAHPF